MICHASEKLIHHAVWLLVNSFSVAVFSLLSGQLPGGSGGGVGFVRLSSLKKEHPSEGEITSSTSDD